MRCCTGDGGGPSRTARQGEVLNRRTLLRLRRVVVNGCGKGIGKVSGAGWEGERKRTIGDRSKQYRRRRNRGPVVAPGMSLAGVLLAGQVASGREVARAQLRLWCGTWEILASKLPVMVEWPGIGSASSSRNCEGSSTVAGQEVGPPGSSEEALVMGVERSGRVVQVRCPVNQHELGGAG